MNSETLFSMALGLQTPWQVKDVTFSTDELSRSEYICLSLLCLARAFWMTRIISVQYLIP
jgi:hypothetical protein